MIRLDILAIDDDITSRLYIQRIISKNKFNNEVTTFNHGQEALTRLDQKAKNLNQVLIFLDINMPVLNGWEFLDELQNKGYKNKVSVLIMSSSTALADKEKSYQYPQVMGYLEKPFTSETILDIIDLFSNNIVIPNLGVKARAYHVTNF